MARLFAIFTVFSTFAMGIPEQVAPGGNGSAPVVFADGDVALP